LNASPPYAKLPKLFLRRRLARRYRFSVDACAARCDTARALQDLHHNDPLNTGTTYPVSSRKVCGTPVTGVFFDVRYT
jgi:hypothetical protein